ncbi:MAG: hypothetical protein HRU15_08260, partial [Planctomycetes bacterium]|nr:hypothetical protein [Planctomycetota bacterium]
MNSKQGMHIARVLILLGLMGYFITSLGTTILGKHRRNTIITNDIKEPGFDPGIRVLLTDRSNHKKYHRRLEILILQASILMCPDPEHGDLRITLDPQETLSIQSALDGIKINCKKIDKTWNVKQVVIQPVLTDKDNGNNTLDRLQPTLFEANDRQAVFSINPHRYRGNLEIIHSGSQRL